MSTLIKRLQFYVKNAMGRSSTKPSLSEKHQGYSLDNLNRPIFPSQYLNASNADTSMENLSQRKYNPSTDSYSGIHEYE